MLQAALLSVAQFDWGSGCEGGKGAPFAVTLPKGDTATVGQIPPGKFAVSILLSSSADVDVQLVDTDAGDAPIIAWCESKPKNRAAQILKGCGLLPSEPGVVTEESVEYGGVTVTYSGYGGSGGNPGKEWITIAGETSSTLTMRAFAFEAGSASISYEWGRVQTGCCLGVVGCRGSFTSSVGEGAYVEVGSIPAGKKDLSVQLTAASDVDVQLYDTASNDTRFGSEGVAIIAYADCGGLSQGETCTTAAGCGELAHGAVCNAGPLGNNDGTAETATYRNRTYSYSGYYGDGTNYGNERVSIHGVLNTPLLMKAFGYAAGSFEVAYTYYEDVPADERPASPAIFWGIADSNAQQPGVVGVYEAALTDAAYVMRRGGTFGLTVYVPDGGAANVSCALSGEVDGTPAAYPSEHVSFSSSTAGSVTSMRGSLSAAAPVGDYTLTCDVAAADGAVLKGSKRMVVLFNPYLADDEAHMDKEEERSEYVEATEGVLFQGLSDNFEGHVWWYDQFLTSNLEVALRSLRRMPVPHRGMPALVSRHLTYAIGTDVCYGKWGEGSYTSGRPSGGYGCSTSRTSCYDADSAATFFGRSFSGWQANCCVEPDAWRGSTSLLALHVHLGHRPVQYCQCFVYAALLTTFGRGLGLASRPVTTFQSAHDTEANRAIDKFFTPEWEPVAGLTSDSIWSFHVWTETFFARSDAGLELPRAVASAGGWQAVDATPQELSVGGSGLATQQVAVYQMGPASLALVKANADPTCAALDADGGVAATARAAEHGCYDTQFVLSEANANINVWMRSDAAACAADTALGCANTSDGAGGVVYYARQGSYETDPWGDEMGTVGTAIYTKRVGAISAACLLDEDAEGWTCQDDGLDITGTYKATEPSGPGEPTACAEGGGSGGTFCAAVGPFAAGGDGGRRRRLSGSSGVAWAMGLAPNASGPLVHEPGHPMSWVRADVNVSAAMEPVNVTCSFTAVALDYSGQPYVRDASGRPDASASTARAQPSQTVQLAAGGAHTFTFLVERPDYLALSPTYLDEQSGLTAVPAAEAFYALELSAHCHASDGASYVRRLEKLLCEPIVATASRERIACAARRGTYPREQSDAAALAHLTTDSCASVGITSPSVNDGYCNPANNVEGCFDGGDCCEYSCWSKNGGFIQLADGGGWEFAHACYTLNASDCIDPAMRSYAPPADFSTPPSPGSFTGATATVAGANNCSALAAEHAPSLGSCSELKQLLCHDPRLAARDCGPAFAAATDGGLNCSAPRCVRTRHRCHCEASWSASYGGETYAGSGCANPDGDPRGEWCVVVPGSCRGEGTAYGAPAPAEDYAVGDGQTFDYCGTGDGELYNATWSAAALATVRAALPDASEPAGWALLNQTVAPPSSPAPPRSPPSAAATPPPSLPPLSPPLSRISSPSGGVSTAAVAALASAGGAVLLAAAVLGIVAWQRRGQRRSADSGKAAWGGNDPKACKVEMLGANPIV